MPINSQDDRQTYANQSQQETETNEIHWIMRDLQKSSMSKNFKIIYRFSQA